MTTRRQEWANRTIPMVLILFVLAWGVRLVGVDVGYFFGDERINDAARAMTGQLIPGQHFYPPFLNYINAAAFAVLYAGARVLDVWPDTAAFRAQYFSDPLPFYVTARVVVAGLAALTAPAFYLVARALRIDGWYAVGAGLLGLMYPLGVYQSHIAKSDVALASFAVLTLLALIRRHQPQAGGREDVVLAVAATIAISFKHSFVFLLLPLVIVHIIALWRSRSGAEAGKSFLRAMLTVGLLWPILNIGTVLDFQEFLAYQRIQSLMSHSDGSFLEAVRLFGTLAAGQVSGITITGALLALTFPIYLQSGLCRLPQRGLLAGIWGAIILSILIELMIVGTRQPVHLWLPQLACLLLLATAMIMDLMRGRLAWIGSLAFGATVVLSAWGVVSVATQATAVPTATEVEAILMKSYRDRRIISYDRFQVPQAAEAIAMVRTRNERLAERYNVILPDVAPERTTGKGSGDALFHMQMPSGMFGLEDVAEDDMEGLIRPFAWPLQPQEWQLDYWLDQDFTLFLVEDFDYLSRVTPSALFRSFYQELADRCALVDTIPPRKPLFLEGEVSLFDCIELTESAQARND